MKRKVDDSSSGYSWMDTYGDMITLLLTFFVLLYSMSNVDSKKWKILVSSLTGKSEQTQTYDNASGIGNVNLESSQSNENDDKNVTKVIEFDDLYYYLKQYVESKNMQSSVSMFKGDGYTFITFQNSIFFDGDSSVLRPEAKEILDFFADAIENITDDIGEIRAYGHTARAGNANVPNEIVGDRTLSCLRANNVIIYLQSKNLIEPKKMIAEGYGENRPLVPHDGIEETRIKNRRVEIYVSKSDKSNLTLDKIYEDINKSINSTHETKSTDAATSG